MNDFELLNGALVNQRNHVLVAVDGLSEQELTTPVAPSHWTPAGLVQHLAFDVERNWFRAVFAGQNVANESGPARAWDVASGGGAAVIERYRHECALADEVIAAHSCRYLSITAAPPPDATSHALAGPLSFATFWPAKTARNQFRSTSKARCCTSPAGVQ